MWHFRHYDPTPQVRRQYSFAACAHPGCEARRTTARVWPVEVHDRPDWPQAVDRDGAMTPTSGWRSPPPGGWPLPNPAVEGREMDEWAKFLQADLLWFRVPKDQS
jgi:hypothetical protein